MKHFKNARGGLAAAALTAFWFLGIAGAIAQQTYDPMRPQEAMPLPNTGTSGSTTATEDEAQPKQNPEFENLPDTAGVEETYYQCIACHSTAIIKQQRISDARWDYLWTWMIEEQGMPKADDETKEKILAYLKTHFSSER